MNNSVQRPRKLFYIYNTVMDMWLENYNKKDRVNLRPLQVKYYTNGYDFLNHVLTTMLLTTPINQRENVRE